MENVKMLEKERQKSKEDDANGDEDMGGGYCENNKVKEDK